MRIEFTSKDLSFAYSNLSIDEDGYIVENQRLNGYSDRTDFWIEVAIYLINNGITDGDIEDENDNIEASWKFIKD